MERSILLTTVLLVSALLPCIVGNGPMGVAHAQAPQAPLLPPPIPDGPTEFAIAENVRIQVEVVTRGLSHPWGLVFLPDGDILVTERAGRVRLIRNGVLNPAPVATIEVAAVALSGLMDIVLHPKFAENKFVYVTYNKPGPNMGRVVTLARGRWDGNKLGDIQDLFVSDAQVGASRLTFGRDGRVYWGIGGGGAGRNEADKLSQDPMSHIGKIVRLRDDGTVPDDNPFVGRAGYKPEIFSLGHRNISGLTLHPVSGDIWEAEMGPQGGDEINVILPGRNYGWPLVSFGRRYEGPRVSDNPYREGIELPSVYWVPAIAVSGMTFYTGDQFPQWKGNLFVGSLQQGRIPLTGHLQRIVFNERGEELRREPMLTSFRQRVRDVRQGPDGFLYVLTEEDAAVLLRIKPATSASSSSSR